MIQDEIKRYITKKKIIKSVTNDGQPSKQYFFLYHIEGMETVLIVHKYTLTDLPDSNTTQKPLKKYKGKTLYFSHYGIKLSTLKEVLIWLKVFDNIKNT